MRDSLCIRLFYHGLIFFLCLSGCGSEDAGKDTAGNEYVYPAEDWQEAVPEDLGMDSARLQELQRFFSPHLSFSLLVVRRGYLVWGKYYGPLPRETLFEVHSLTKSVTSALAGIAMENGLFGLDQPTADFVDAWAPPDPRSEITIRQILTMTSGLHRSRAEYIPIILSRLGLGEGDILKLAHDLRLEHEPGSHWAYNNTAAMALSQVFSRSTGMELRDYAREKLFEPIGMRSVEWLTDRKGHTLTFMGIFATARDLARFGYLFLREGQWGDRQVVPADWVDLTTRVYSLHPAYGYFWWANGYQETWKPQDGESDFHRPKGSGYYFGEAYPELFSALGSLGQMVLVIPELELVMVRTGLSNYFDYATAVGLLCRSVLEK